MMVVAVLVVALLVLLAWLLWLCTQASWGPFSIIALVICFTVLAMVVAKQKKPYNLIEQKKVYRIEVPFNGVVRTYTGTELKTKEASVSFRDSATGNTVILQNAIVTKIRDSLNQGGK